ncbi:MAG: abhydrolase domain-containing 18 [Pyrinomonadaceae bacterium]|nr:abhydrolase domain-containing 18 [Pyrinomonadaceae bacterium]
MVNGSMFERRIHKKEKYYAMLNDNRVVRPFGWGLEFIGEDGVDEPEAIFRDYADKMVRSSHEFFALPGTERFEVAEQESTNTSITWESSVQTPSIENNTARARFFEHKKDKKAAVLVLPHWNAKAGTYFDLCQWFNRVGVSALRLTLPYHEERMPPELERADYLVAPNIGRTLQSVRQSVLDTRAAIKWLKQEGYERVGIVGTSIGSCVAFFAFVHDETIDSAVFNHVSGYFADVVWEGLSTYHVKEGLENDVGLEELRKYWMPISPMAYMDKLKASKPRPQRYIYTKYDLTFPYHLSMQMMRKLESTGVEHVQTEFPCGHYTLGEKPWVYLDGYKIISFLRKHLR